MATYLVSSSHRVYFEQAVEAPNEDLARIEVMKMNKKLIPLAYSGYGVDSIEEWLGELPENLAKNLLIA